VPPLKIKVSASGYRSNPTVSRVFYSVSTEYRIIKFKDVLLPSRNIIMVIPKFVKTCQIFQICECEEQINQGSRTNGDIKLCILEIFSFPKDKLLTTLISTQAVCPLPLLLKQLTSFH